MTMLALLHTEVLLQFFPCPQHSDDEQCVRVTRTRTRTLELLLYNLSRLRLSVHRFFLEAARVLEVARIRCFLVS
nr:hypothetical protein CFP56_53884 [Quercus suber]